MRVCGYVIMLVELRCFYLVPLLRFAVFVVVVVFVFLELSAFLLCSSLYNVIFLKYLDGGGDCGAYVCTFVQFIPPQIECRGRQHIFL